MKTLEVVFLFSPFFCSLASAQTVSSGFIDVGTNKIFFEAAGEGPVIVFIHDGLVHREVWDYQYSCFSKTHRVIRYDRRGYGNSTEPTEAFSNVADLNSLFSHLGIERACLMAMSSGGALAIDFTLQFPDKVSSIILVGAVVGGFPYTQHFYNRGGHLPPGLMTAEERSAYYALDDPYEIFSGNPAAKEKVARLVKENPRKGHGSSSMRASIKPAFRRLNEIKIPTLILVGEFDIPDVHAHAGAIQAGIENSRREIVQRSGHLIPIEQPQRFNRIVEGFLAEAGMPSVPDSEEDDSGTIRVPEGDGTPVLIDGLFSTGEWDDAAKIDVHENVSLYLKEYGGHIFIGVKISPFRTSVIDIFISPDGKAITHLHASAQIGERLVSENSELWDNPPFVWGNSTDWYANEIRWDNGKMQKLIEEGKSGDEAQAMSYFKSDGFEFQIRKSKFASDRWLFRVEVPMAPDFDKPVIYPGGTVMKTTEGWLRLILN